MIEFIDTLKYKLVLIFCLIFLTGGNVYAMGEVSNQDNILDHFVLDQSGNALEMCTKLGELIKKHNNNFEVIDQIIKRDNAAVVYFNTKKTKHFYKKTVQKFLHTKVFIVGLEENKNVITDYGCNIGDR